MTEEQRPPLIQPKRTRKTISPAKWAEIEQAWAQGKFESFEDMAGFYKQDMDNLRKHMKRKGIKKGQAIEEYNRKVASELEQKAVESAKLLSARIEETREEHYKMATGIAKLTWAEILKAKQDGAPFAAIRTNVQALESAMKVLKMAREERFAVLGLNKDEVPDDEEETPELVISELTQDEIEDLRSRSEPEEQSSDDIVDLASDLGLVDIDDEADD